MPALRQRSMAVNTFRCSRVSQVRLRSMNAGPAARTRSATSSGGASIYWFCGAGCLVAALDSSSESSGLAVALRWRLDRCR